MMLNSLFCIVAELHVNPNLNSCTKKSSSREKFSIIKAFFKMCKNSVLEEGEEEKSILKSTTTFDFEIKKEKEKA